MSADRGLVVVLEDERAIAEMERLYLQQAGFGVHVAIDGQAGLADIRRLAPVAVIVDIGLPGLDGVEVVRRLRADDDWVPVIFVTAHDSEVDRVVGLELGADDYVTKPFSPRELVARIGAVLRRVRPGLAGESLSYADLEMDTVGHKVRRSGEVIQLGPTEFRLLKHFLEHPGWVFSRERLLDAVWGHGSDIEVRTVDVHIRRLRKAINEGGRPDVIRTVRSAGYALDTGA